VDGKHYWLTPWDEPAFVKLIERFGPFDFDPCPWPRPEGFDGLTCEWGSRSYANIPFGSTLWFPPSECTHVTATPKSRTCIKCGVVGQKRGPTAWIRKARLEASKGKLIVLVYPLDKWVFLAVPEIINLGDVRWRATEDGSRGKGTGRHIAALIFDGRTNPERWVMPMAKAA